MPTTTVALVGADDLPLLALPIGGAEDAPRIEDAERADWDGARIVHAYDWFERKHREASIAGRALQTGVVCAIFLTALFLSAVTLSIRW